MKKGKYVGISVILAFMLICVALPMNVAADYCVISEEKIETWDTDSDGYKDAGELSFKISNTNDAYDTDVWITWYSYEPNGDVGATSEEGPYTITDGDSQIFKERYNLDVGDPKGSYKIAAYIYWESTSVWSDSTGDDTVEKTVSLYPPGYGDSEDDTTDDDTPDDDKKEDEKKESSDSPGFELFGVALAIGLCITVIGWRKRRTTHENDNGNVLWKM